MIVLYSPESLTILKVTISAQWCEDQTTISRIYTTFWTFQNSENSMKLFYIWTSMGWTTLVEKKCIPCKDLARFSCKVLQVNAFLCKTSCKYLARRKISLQDSFKEKCFLARIFQGQKVPWKILAHLLARFFLGEECSIVTLLVKFYVLSRKQIPCKIMQGKYFLARSFKETISLQDLARETFPCKIFQGNNFLARSCKEKISLKDLPRKAFFKRFLQDPCKECIFFQPG